MTQPTTTSPEFHAKLHEALNQYFDDEELHTLCFDIGVDYDGLKGAGKAAKARELITYIDRRNRIADPGLWPVTLEPFWVSTSTTSCCSPAHCRRLLKPTR